MGGKFLKSADFLEDIYIPQEVELLPEGYKYCSEIRSGMGYIPLAVPLILELPELQIIIILPNFCIDRSCSDVFEIHEKLEF